MTLSVLTDRDPALQSDIFRLIKGEHWDPHQLLGLHPMDQNSKVIRLFRPGASEIYLELSGKIVEATKVHEAGLFELLVPEKTGPLDYRIYHQNGLLAHDPYVFLPTFGEMDAHLFNKGVHYQIYEQLGAHPTIHQGVKGVKFAVWAPSAMAVSLVCDSNFWDGRLNPMRSLGACGVWELFVPGLEPGVHYKFEIRTKSGELKIKSDPYGNAFELRPKTASVVTEIDRHVWGDSAWLKKRSETPWKERAMNIYEVQLGSWRRPYGEIMNYRKVALELASYCKEMGYTHVELMPISEYPFDESWGYQVCGFYAPTARYGSASDFQFFVDHLHQEGIGVILDWVPAHFPTDEFALARFDGTALYEHGDPRQGYHPHWNTLIFNYGRHEVSNFLIANALFWLEKMHVDGLRVDAVASMLYLDYGREEGNWIPNAYGGKENLEAIEFLKHLNAVVHERVPGALMIAEESTAFTGVTTPVSYGGLGFDLKWNMGWMNDTLRYIRVDPIFRKYHQNELTFGLIYAFSERFELVLSHDEVVHGKGSLLTKCPGDLWQRFANLRLLLSYLITQPGKKMLFMGGELGQWNEWWCQEEIHWHLLQYPNHQKIQNLVRDINRFYLSQPPLWQRDFDYSGFEWVDFSDTENSVLAYRRKGDAPYELLCVHHFTPNFFPDYQLNLPGVKSIRELFNSDDVAYGGSGKTNPSVEIVENERGEGASIRFTLAPLATMIFEIRY